MSELAAALRTARASAGADRPITFRDLGQRANTSAAALNKATSGRTVPTWPVVKAFVEGCGHEPQDYRELWERAKADAAARTCAAPAPPGDDARPAGPSPSGRRTRLDRWTAAVSARTRDTADRRPRRSAAVVVVAAVLVTTVIAVAVATGQLGDRQGGLGPAPSAGPASAVPSSLSGGPAAPAPETGTAPGTASATIVSPAGPTVPHKFSMSGTVTDLPHDALLYAVTVELDDNRVYPAAAPCLVTTQHSFDCGTYYVGVYPGSEYLLLIVSAGPAAAKAFRQYHDAKVGPGGKSIHGMDSLPSEATVLVEKRVVLVA